MEEGTHLLLLSVNIVSIMEEGTHLLLILYQLWKKATFIVASQYDLPKHTNHTNQQIQQVWKP